MDFINGLLFTIIILGGLAIVYVVIYNKLQTTNSKIQQAESIIDETLRNKYDGLALVNNVYKKFAKNNKDYLKEIDDLKTKKITNFEFDRKLKEIFNTVMELKNDHKDLQDDKDFKKIISDIKDTDEKLAAAKIYYNKYTNQQNEIVRKFPANIIGKIHGYKVRFFFDGKDLEDDIINDFKL